MRPEWDCVSLLAGSGSVLRCRREVGYLKGRVGEERSGVVSQ